MKDISKDIIARIKAEHLMPESRFRLQWKNYAFWILMIGMIIAGALSASLVVFNMVDLDPGLFHYMQLHKFLRVLLLTAPFLWIFLSILALVFGVMAFRKTSRGYRKSLLFVSSLVVLIISILGVMGHIAKVSRIMDRVIIRNTPEGFRDLSGRREGRWERPGDGLIGGEVMRVGHNEFFLQSFRSQEEWKILLDERTQKNGIEEIIMGEKIGVIGEKGDGFVMRALSIRKFPSDWDGLPPKRVVPCSGEGKCRPIIFNEGAEHEE